MEFRETMDKMKDLNCDAYDWLMNVRMHTWARHTFDHAIKSDHITNNLCESFNNWVGLQR